MADLPGVEFIIFDKQAGLKNQLKLLRQLKGRHFDILLNMQVALRASLISLFISAPVKLGFDRLRAHDYQWLFTNQKIDPISGQHVLEGFFGFLEKLGIRQRCLQWDIPIPEQAQLKVSQVVQQDKPLLVINACSSSRIRNWRNWPAERYAAVIDYAIEELGMQVALSGGPTEQETNMANEIIQLSKNTLINMVGQTTLKELLALLRQASVVIAPDTGPIHMATAAGTQAIGLYATSNPMRTGPYLYLNKVVNYYPQALKKYSKKTIEEARWGERVRHPDAMKLIPVEDVVQQLKKVMR